MQAFKCFIIRLEENELSCRIAEDCFNQATKHNVESNYFKAILGHDWEFHYAKLNIRRAGKFKKNRVGVLGCFLSHYYLWKQCVDDNIPYLILEHDGYFIKNLPNDILDKFDDVLKLDRLDPYSSSYNNSLDAENNLPITVLPYTNPSSKYKTRIGLGTTYFKGAYSYIIKPHAAKKIVDHININGHVTADQQINNLIVKLETTSPTVARLHPFYSTDGNIKSASLTGNPDLLILKNG
jgi:GR25 family glycosyltransferase involved in LPS biosynthesis